MRKIICLLLAFAIMQSITTAQCGIKKKQYLRNCEGIYLDDLVVKSYPNKIKKTAFVLNKNVKYAFYMLNPSNDFPDLKITRISKMDSIPVNFELNFNKDKNYKVFVFKPDFSATYLFEFDFGTQKDACILFALYFREKVN